MESIEMSEKTLEAICLKNQQYRTPSLNDVLYLHFCGFRKIENLEKYTNLKSLWLESNSIEKIEGLQYQIDLRALFLHKNFIKKIENLDTNCLLNNLNLAENCIERIENLAHLKNLRTLNLSRNYLTTCADLQALIEIEGLAVLDISHNRINDTDCLFVLKKMAALKVLYLFGNPVVKQILNYRKNLILNCLSLTYLDQRPISDRERAMAEAWLKNGSEGETEEKKRWDQNEHQRLMESVQNCLKLRN